MNNETMNELNGMNDAEAQQKWDELVKGVLHNGQVALQSNFGKVEGQVLHHDNYGPIFIYQVQDSSDNGYVCGFFLRELLTRFQSNEDPSDWMASFYFELMKTEGGRPLPEPPSTEEEAKALIDKALVPHCISVVKEEFAPEEVHAGLAMNEEYGPVFETGFPSIVDGNNVCAFPLHLLFTQLLLNRDPADVLLQGLYKIREEHGLE
ncbi:conserved hypothetical protein [Paenibacillus curdlanolyticus YK9]|uniref:Uncharacterized protein n=1 Tax=Paenibacillus curdlanolyticus YK9 TaxID=717606 RepID=E0I4J6_9BACL|nr:hypothetical protein [Paenibacillus curdlanolyticus]EFM12527.1 conserved hypothetical protein [Paenibacillus curdlanolyticus YK9]